MKRARILNVCQMVLPGFGMSLFVTVLLCALITGCNLGGGGGGDGGSGVNPVSPVTTNGNEDSIFLDVEVPPDLALKANASSYSMEITNLRFDGSTTTTIKEFIYPFVPDSSSSSTPSVSNRIKASVEVGKVPPGTLVQTVPADSLPMLRVEVVHTAIPLTTTVTFGPTSKMTTVAAAANIRALPQPSGTWDDFWRSVYEFPTSKDLAELAEMNKNSWGIKYSWPTFPPRFPGHPNRMFRIRIIDIPPGKSAEFEVDGKPYSIEVSGGERGITGCGSLAYVGFRQDGIFYPQGGFAAEVNGDPYLCHVFSYDKVVNPKKYALLTSYTLASNTLVTTKRAILNFEQDGGADKLPPASLTIEVSAQGLATISSLVSPTSFILDSATVNTFSSRGVIQVVTAYLTQPLPEGATLTVRLNYKSRRTTSSPFEDGENIFYIPIKYESPDLIPQIFREKIVPAPAGTLVPATTSIVIPFFYYNQVLDGAKFIVRRGESDLFKQEFRYKAFPKSFKFEPGTRENGWMGSLTITDLVKFQELALYEIEFPPFFKSPNGWPSATFTWRFTTGSKNGFVAPDISGLASGSFNLPQRFRVIGSVPGAKYELTLDGGKTWANTYSRDEGYLEKEFTYNAMVRQTLGDLVATSPSYQFTIDTTPPLPPVIGNTETRIFTQAKTLTLTGEPGARMEYTLNDGITWIPSSGSFTIASASSYLVRGRQYDRAGNVSNPTSPAVAVQMIDQIVTLSPKIIGLTSGTYNRPVSFSLEGVGQNFYFDYTLDGGTTWETALSSVVLNTEGTYRIKARLMNLAGTYSPESAELQVTLKLTLPLPPTISGIAPGTYNATQTFTVIGADSDMKLEYLLFDGGIWKTYTGPVPLSLTATYVVRARQTDVSGNVSPSTDPITLSVAIPSIPSPVADAVASSTIAPGEGAVEVDLFKPLVVPFTKALDSATVTNTSVKVTSAGTPIVGNVSYTPATKEITFVPTNGYPSNATVICSLTADIKTTEAAPIEPYSFSFKTLNLTELTAWWRFENNTTDSSGNGHTLTAVGAPSVTNAKSRMGEYSCLFNGSSRYQINGGANFDLGNKFTVSAWVFIPTGLTTSMKTIIANGPAGGEQMNGFKFCVNTWGQLDKRIMIEAGTGGSPNGGKMRTATDQILENNWYHLAFSIDKTTGIWKVYYNGANVPWTFTSDQSFTEANFNSVVKTGVGTNQATYIGAFTDGQYGFNGYIDDLRIYKKILTDADVLKISQEK